MIELECEELDGSVAFTVGVAAALTIGFATATVGVAVGFTVGVAAALPIGFATATVGVAVGFTVGVAAALTIGFATATVGVAVGFTVGVVAFAFCPEFISMWAVLELGLTTTVPY